MVEKMNGKLVVTRLGYKADCRSELGSSLASPSSKLLKCFRRVWPEKKEGSKHWFKDWESWRLQTE